MKTVAIICEYNPFHYGHLFQIEEIKRRFGEDTRIVAIMSGNYVQRGDLAIIDKYARARSAIKHGASLVLELPFPYSCASAEYFARAGVDIANRLGVIEHLCFGSLSSDTDELEALVSLLASDAFKEEFETRVKNDEYANLGHAALVERICREISSDKCVDLLHSPNDILGVEYLRSLRLLNSKIIASPIPLLDSTEHTGCTSASDVREALRSDRFDPSRLPAFSGEAVDGEIKRAEAPSDLNRLSAAILSHLLRSEDGSLDKFLNCGGGLINRLRKLANEASSLSALTALAATKRYTDSRIRRALIFSFIGVTSSDVSEPPAYTQVLGMNEVGRALLRETKKTREIDILTKPADFSTLGDAAKAQGILRNRADSMRNLSLPAPRAPGDIFRSTPYCEF